MADAQRIAMVLSSSLSALEPSGSVSGNLFCACGQFGLDESAIIIIIRLARSIAHERPAAEQPEQLPSQDRLAEPALIFKQGAVPWRDIAWLVRAEPSRADQETNWR